MLAFIMIIAFGILFLGLFLSTATRRYTYKKHGVLLDGKVVGYDRSFRSTRSIVSFRHNKKSMQMPLLQVFMFFYPKMGTKVRIYYAEHYNDYVLLANAYPIISQTIFLLFGLAFTALGVLGILGYIPTK